MPDPHGFRLFGPLRFFVATLAKSGSHTNAFSKKVDNHMHALSLYFAFYNLVRIHKSLKVTPAMAAGVTDRLWSMEDTRGRRSSWRGMPS